MKKSGIITGILMAVMMAFGGKTVSAQEAIQKGSIRIKCDAAEFAVMAKISIDNAIKTALKEVPGKVLKAEIENENGFLVYGVEIAKTDHQIVDVKVDAGNGKILKTEFDHEHGEDHDQEDSDRGH